MIKRDIEWHRNNLIGLEKYIQQEEAIIQRQIASIQKSKDLYALLKNQIETAEKEGKKSFDSEKYLLKRKNKEAVK